MILDDIKKTNNAWIPFIVVVLMFFLSMMVVSMFSLGTFMEVAKEESDLTGMRSVEKDAAVLNGFANDRKGYLQEVWRVVDYVLKDSGTISSIEEFLVEEMSAERNTVDSSFVGIFGYVDGRYVDGRLWAPPAGYNPKEQPWFRAAVKAEDGGVRLVYHEDPKDKRKVITASRVLPGNHGVLALSFNLEFLRETFKPAKGARARWLLMSVNGEIIEHYDSTEVYQNYLSDTYWGTDKERFARQVARTRNGVVEVVYNGHETIAYVTPVQKDWLLVHVVDKSDITENIRLAVARNVLIVLLFFIVMTGVISTGFYNHLKKFNINRKKQFILDKMNHEMHAAVNGILGLNSVVMKSVRDKEIKRYAQSVSASVQEMSSLISDIQDVSSLGYRRENSKMEGYELYSLLSDCYKTLLPKAKMKNLQVTLECDQETPSNLWGDANAIRRTINNILTDAVKRTESGGILINVGFDVIHTTSQSAEKSIVLKIFIRDTGEGLSVGRDAVTDDWNDASAELSLAKLLLDSCGGELVVKSRYGESTTFMVSVPQIVLNVEPIGNFLARFQEQNRTENNVHETLFAPSARILVVDDVDMNLKVVRGLLRDTKVQIDTAINSSQCLELTALRRYDLILLDYSLPIVNGIKTFERMKRIENSPNKNTPVVIATAKTVEFSDSYLNLGLTDFISKPYMEKDLMRILAWYLPKHLILTREDLLDLPQRKSVEKSLVKDAGMYGVEELEFHSVLTPEERLKVFEDVLNVKVGLEYFSHDVKCYYEILQEFVREDKTAAFKKAFLTKDWNNYLTLVHSVHGVAAAIGAEILTRNTHEVENACKEYKFDEVVALHENFMAIYVNCIESIKKGLTEYEA